MRITSDLKIEGKTPGHGVIQFDAMHAQSNSSSTIYCGSHLDLHSQDPSAHPLDPTYVIVEPNPNKLLCQEAIMRTLQIDYIGMRDAMTTLYPDTNIVTFTSNIV